MALTAGRPGSYFRIGRLRARSMHRAHDVSRPAPHLYIDAPDVFADETERKKDHSDKKEQDCEEGPQCAFFLGAIDQSMSQHDRGQQRVEDEYSYPGQA